MATRLRVLLFSIFPVLSLFSFEFSEKDVKYRPMYGMGFEIVNQQLIVSKAVTIEVGKPKTRYYEYIRSSTLEINRDGYFYMTIFKEKKCIIPGSRFLFLFSNRMEEMNKTNFNNSLILNDVESKFKETGHLAGIHAMCYESNLISSIKSSSYLKGGSIGYNTYFLDKRLVFGEAALSWNGDAQPWVEGVTGPGIGETLTINFTEPSEDIVILNGFVDPLRRHLYRYNNRVKTAIIRSADTGETFEFEHTFEDVVHFDEIQLPRPAMKLIFEIKDVYPGEKWDDTCISAVLTREPDPYK